MTRVYSSSSNTVQTMDPILRSPTKKPDSDALCEICLGINLQGFKSCLGYEHQPDFGTLITNSSTCALCDLIMKSLKRALNMNRALGPNIAEDIGPVRLVGAGRSLAQQQGYRRCPEGPVEESLLWREVAVTIGKDQYRTRCFSEMGAQLDMTTAKGKYCSMTSLTNSK